MDEFKELYGVVELAFNEGVCGKYLRQLQLPDCKGYQFEPYGFPGDVVEILHRLDFDNEKYWAIWAKPSESPSAGERISPDVFEITYQIFLVHVFFECHKQYLPSSFKPVPMEHAVMDAKRPFFQTPAEKRRWEAQQKLIVGENK